MAESLSRDEMVAHFSGISGASPPDARQYLASHGWDLESALTAYLNHQDEPAGDQEDENDLDDDPDFEDDSEDDLSGHGPGRRLGDGPTGSSLPQPSQSTAGTAKNKNATQQKKFATLGDVGASSGGGNDDDDDEEKQDMFAGGEKSGLAVHNPESSEELKKRILEKAMRKQKTRSADPVPATNHFSGAARTLGGDDAPSREIPAEVQAGPSRAERVERTLHFWNNGFSIDDGELYSTDNPENAEILDGIRRGRAPLHIMGVRPGQEVDVEIKQHQEDYVKPKKKFTPFGGQGNRLGSPTPGVQPMPGSFVTAPTAPAPTASVLTAPPVDDSKPQLSLRISLGDGTRLTSRFNTDSTIGDVYDFVRRADSSGRDFVLQTTFPTKVLEDERAILGEISEFKRGGVVVQKFT